ncbi:hypothetical protein M8J75_010558 [Diaphorina citri]|nr:hypothetical protein M8J75_010558 [Diaphorina citri]KAI5738787.1 hypothetical protein M8J77_011214 [Diaphorina citri]
MSDSMIKKLSSNDFNVEKFVKELSQHCVGGLELQQKRVEIGALAEETNSLLKKNVFHNYMLFIETAKEISHLEGEMYQLSHLLTEQRSLLATLAHTSIVEGVMPILISSSSGEQAQAKKQLIDIMQKVEGCVNLLDSSRSLIYEGDLTELDALENKPMRRIHAYLLSDLLILATPSQQSPGRYQLNTSYELPALPVVNIRHIASAFKLLAFPDTRVFQAPSAAIKKEWLDHFDAIKKGKVGPDQNQKSTDVKTPASGNPFDEDDDDEEDEDPHEDLPPPVQIPEWLHEVPEDLDVLIVERHFEEAYHLIEKTREYLNEPSGGNSLDSAFVQECERKLNARVETLTAMLTKELEVTPDKSLQGGLRSARPFIRVLNQLNKTSLSCDLFLALCSSILRAQLKRVRRDGPALSYVTSASTVFFTNLSLMITELQKVSFPSTGECAAAFVVWATREFNLFVSHVIRELFVTQSSLSTLSPCIAAVSAKCDQLTSLGLDLRYLLDGALRSPLTKTLKETRDKLADTIKLRCAEDRWKPYNLNNRQQRDKFLAEFTDAGLTSMSSYLTGDCWLRLSHNTILFTRLYLSLLDDCINLATSDLIYNIEETLYAVMQAQLRHVDASLRNDKLAEEREFIVQNADFILNNLLTLCEKKFQDHFKFQSKKLTQVRKEFQHLA